jgi:hypothetical protein
MERITPEDFHTMRRQLNEVHSALIGNPIAQDGGMVKRLSNVETKVAKVEKMGAKLGWHFKLLWGAAGCILMAMWSLFIKK